VTVAVKVASLATAGAAETVGTQASESAKIDPAMVVR
jgi:hypothetical protein